MRKTGFLIKFSKGLLILGVVVPLLAALVLSAPAQAAPAITLSPSAGAVGTEVTVTGSVFDSYIGDNIYVFFNDEEIAGSPLTVTETGTFTISFTIPEDTEPGRYWVEARSETASTSMLAKNFFVIEATEIYLDVEDGTVGTEVTVSGKGFYAYRTITIYYYNKIKEKSGTVVASPTGDFTYLFAVPTGTAGDHKITAENTEGDSAEVEFEVLPSISLNLNSGGPGELLTARGTGFGPRSVIEISFGIYSIAKAQTDEYGNFETQFNIPGVMPGTYDVKAQDAQGNMDREKFTTTAGASLDQKTGAVGTTVTVEGSGFTVGGTLTIYYDNLPVATVSTDNDGAFSSTFSIPASSGGSHQIKVTDGETTRLLPFTMESEAPRLGELLFPAANSETKSRVNFDWEDATDPSQPITYSLQVASDLNFASIVISKEGLTGSEYTLSEEEQLPAVPRESPYYWRVKAKDSANNESEWSAPRSFYISAPATPTLLLPVAGIQAELPLQFDWQDVPSLNSPVTYRLQIASDQNFSATVLEETKLTSSAYTVADTVANKDLLPELKGNAPYYWRVKAIDSARNESGWSSPWSFYMGTPFTMPGWVMYTLIGIVVLVVIFFAFRIGRRTAYSSPP